jgi:peptidoglycan/LPS O-acetylase OafA/YrhL
MDRLKELEGLRGPLAWWVLCGHLAFVFSDTVGRLLDGKSAVHVFVVLSGFVVTLLLDNKRETYGAFITRRFFRLYPVYALLLLVSAATLDLQQDILAASPLSTARHDFRLELLDEAQDHFWPHLLAHLTMLHGLVPTDALPHADVTLLGQAWSISVEWQYYLLAPAVFLGLTHGRRGLWITIAAAILLFALPKIGFKVNPAFLPKLVTWFALGIASYFIWKRRDDPRIRRVGLIGSLVLLIGGVVSDKPGTVVWAAFFPVLLGFAPRVTDAVRAFLGLPFMQLLGRISYSTYLVHMLVIYAGVGLLGRAGLSGHAYMAALVAWTVVVTFVASLALYRWVERPGMKLGATLAARFVKQEAVPASARQAA